MPGLFESLARQPLTASRDPESAVVGWAEPAEPVTVSMLRWAGLPPVGRARTKVSPQRPSSAFLTFRL